ncbi:RAMP4 family protein [Aspergillus novofumigatus IBT 16806]|uniref:Stress-associated endoplasmic reticulum protein n=1 Tax=Aspergillus novofumigatus (strain IBT 16806) TaxID=1392255 RepID=A0A2I1BZU3_ASPN1|nr:uncharacterized protein P174DRAFT_276686 [Aspergillus novofumigatus IBT 16806]PKX90884.1 hypothetical protein P174DRAFT_276686 [Aspergillus novofumigatus IBT 16806]
MAQTPQQRRANERYAKHEAAKRGKGQTTAKPKQNSKSPVSTGWLVILAFVVCGGVAFELLRVTPAIWSAATTMLGRFIA